jgi:RNA polymerase sigma-70 factor (ECF subfamily)
MTQDADQGRQHFSTTQWSLVGRAGHGNDDERKEALDRLLRRYMPALRAHLIHAKRLQPAAAEDLLQEFILTKVVERNLISQADPARGRFRSFLLSSLNYFLIDEHRREHTAKRSPHAAVPIDENLDAAPGEFRPQDAFDVAWARELISDATQTMREKCQLDGRLDVWDIFQGRLLDPLLHDAAPVSYDELIAKHRLPSPHKASNLLVTAQRMFARILRERIAQYEPDAAMIDAEIDDLLTILSGRKA